MKEIKIKVKNASHKQWALLLIELNMLKDSWRRYGPTLNIKANNFNKIEFNKQTGPLLWRYIRYF